MENENSVAIYQTYILCTHIPFLKQLIEIFPGHADARVTHADDGEATVSTIHGQAYRYTASKRCELLHDMGHMRDE